MYVCMYVCMRIKTLVALQFLILKATTSRENNLFKMPGGTQEEK